MKALSFSFLVIGLLASCSHDPEPNITLVFLNPDFESGTVYPDSWFHFNSKSESTPDTVTTWTTEESSSPSHSLRFSKTVADPVNWTYAGQVYNTAIPVGKDVTLSIKIKGKNLSGQGVALALRGDSQATTDVQFVTTEGTTSINGTFDWTEFKITMPAVQSNVSSILVYLIYLPGTTGTVYFDDASLTERR